MLLVDEAVMYESSALNKNLNLSNVTSGYFLSFNSSLVQVQLLCDTAWAGALGETGPHWCPLAGSLLL